MEDSKSPEIKDENSFSSPFVDIMSSTRQEGMNGTVDGNVAVEKEPEYSFESNNIDLTDDFLVNLLSRDTTDDVDSSKQEVKVQNSVEASVTECWGKKDKNDTHRVTYTLEQNKANDTLICNSVNSPNEKIEVEIMKEVEQVKVHRSFGESILSKGDIVAEYCNENVKNDADCVIHGLEQNIVNNMLVCNPVSSPKEKLEVEVIKGDLIEENKQVKVNKSIKENETSEGDGAEYCKEKKKDDTDCVILDCEQSSINMLICNSASSRKEDLEIEMIKEVVIEDASHTCDHREQPVKNNSTEYRCNSDSWTDDEDSSTSDSSSSSDSDDAFFQAMHEEISIPKKMPPVKTKGELALDDLPPIEDLAISVNEGEMMIIGKVHAIVDTLVVVRAVKGMKPLDLDSVLFLSHDQPLGRIFDVFGPVSEPFYSVRFNNVEQINDRSVKVGGDVFFAPDKSDITTYVFLEELQNQKGSDASWKHNNEPPEEFLDYSDDEKEKRAKDQRRNRNRNRQFSNSDAPAKRPFLEVKGGSVPTNYIPPPRSAPPCNNFQTISLRISRPNPFQSRIPPVSPSPVHSFMSPVRISRPNPFQSRIPPPSPSPSVWNPPVMSPVRFPNSYGTPPHQPRQVVQNQNILYRPPSQVLLSPYQQSHIFGQVTVMNPLSPALQAPSPLPSPVLNSIPALIPASHFSSQNYYSQRFARSPSPASHTQHMPPDPWLPNRSPNCASVPPSHPLSVQIPNMNSPSFQMQQIPQDRCPVEPFVNCQIGGLQSPVPVLNNRNWSSGNMQPRFYHN